MKKGTITNDKGTWKWVGFRGRLYVIKLKKKREEENGN